MYEPIGAVTVIVPVLIAQVDCVSAVVGTDGTVGAEFIISFLVEVQPFASFAIIVYVLAASPENVVFD